MTHSKVNGTQNSETLLPPPDCRTELLLTPFCVSLSLTSRSAERTAVFLWIKNLSDRKPREIKMKMLLFLLLMGIVGPHCTSARTHSLKYFHTGSSGVTNFPEFVAVGLVDEVEITHYDSNTKREEPKQDWMKKITDEDPQYWERSTQISLSNQQFYKVGIETLKQRFNQTGEDFLILDLETESWIAPKRESFLTKLKWDKNKALMAQQKNYFTQICPEFLKKYVNNGRSFLMRTVDFINTPMFMSPVFLHFFILQFVSILTNTEQFQISKTLNSSTNKEIPSVSLLQKSPSSPVSCHATGFYPDRAIMFWTEDGEELHENVDHGEILPNHDGSFQMSVDLDVSSFPAEHWDKYRCVFQLSGVKEDHVIVLDPAVIRTNRANKSTPSPASSAELIVKLNQPSEYKPNHQTLRASPLQHLILKPIKVNPPCLSVTPLISPESDRALFISCCAVHSLSLSNSSPAG
ncbi:hypothetical protein F7725_024680 [Dissostichus mawsoni]|uniref:Ig-like domain-containing protein n=1 Tax=Dissostichus mawsoni TaxID=36200 RepID=A0A7J5X8Z6_DISMA|nr:hypothetical protein F7725_024680 [Dissostichus mawsoni]